MAVPRSPQPALTVNLNLRVSEGDQERLYKLADRVGMASSSAVARRALRVGLEALEADPGRMLAPAAIEADAEVKA